MICHKNIPSYYLPYLNAFSSKLTKISMLSMVIIDLYFTWASYSSSSMVALPGTVAMVLFWMKSFSLLISSLTRLFNCSLLHRKKRDSLLHFFVHNTLYMYTSLLLKIVTFTLWKLSRVVKGHPNHHFIRGGCG